MLSPVYLKLLFTFYIIWLGVSLIIKKFHFDPYASYWDAMLLYAKSAILNAYCVSVMVVLMHLTGFSRLHIYGTCALLFIMNVAIFSIYYVSISKKKVAEIERERIEPGGKPRISIPLLSSDFLLITSFFFVINYYKRETFILSPHYEHLFLVILCVWLVCSMITGKFYKRNFQNYYYAMAACAKAAILMAATMSVLMFALRLFYYSRSQIFGTFLMPLVGEAVLYYLYFIFRKGEEVGRDIESVDEMQEFLQQRALTFEKEGEDVATLPSVPVKEKLYHVFDFFNPCGMGDVVTL